MSDQLQPDKTNGSKGYDHETIQEALEIETLHSPHWASR